MSVPSEKYPKIHSTSYLDFGEELLNKSYGVNQKHSYLRESISMPNPLEYFIQSQVKICNELLIKALKSLTLATNQIKANQCKALWNGWGL